MAIAGETPPSSAQARVEAIHKSLEILFLTALGFTALAGADGGLFSVQLWECQKRGPVDAGGRWKRRCTPGKIKNQHLKRYLRPDVTPCPREPVSLRRKACSSTV